MRNTRTASAPAQQQEKLQAVVASIKDAQQKTYRFYRHAPHELRRLFTQGALEVSLPLAAVASMLPQKKSLTLSAASPRTRLLVEMFNEPSLSNATLTLVSAEAGVVHEYAPTSSTLDANALRHTRWWLQKPYFPLQFSCGSLLGSISITDKALDGLSSVVVTWAVERVKFSAHLMAHLEELTIHGEALAHLSAMAARMTGLRKVSVSEATPASLRVLSRVPNLRDVCIDGVFKELDLATWASVAVLERLTVSSPRAKSVLGLRLCVSLQKVDLAGGFPPSVLDDCAAVPTLTRLRAARSLVCPTPFTWTHRNIVSLNLDHCMKFVEPSSLSLLPHLRTLNANASGLRTLAGLNACASLVAASFSACKHLLSLSGLAGAPRLRWLSATNSTVCDVAGLCACRSLRVVHLTGCASLHDITSLAGTPMLREIHAATSGVWMLAELRRCPELRKLVLDKCGQLQNCEGFAGAPKLRTISLEGSGVSNLDGLSTCPSLEYVNVSMCQNLLTLQGLAGAPQLRRINAAESQVMHLGPLFLCPNLTKVHLCGCAAITSLAPLGGAPQLQSIVACHSGVVDLQGLCGCPQLRSVNFAECKKLESLSALAGAPRLRDVNAQKSGVRSLLGLNACPSLTYIDLSHCTQLATMYPLNLMAQVTIIC